MNYCVAIEIAKIGGAYSMEAHSKGSTLWRRYSIWLYMIYSWNDQFVVFDDCSTFFWFVADVKFCTLIGLRKTE